MARNKPRKTDRKFNPEAIKTAVAARRAGKSIRSAAKEGGIDKETLRRYLKKVGGDPSDNSQITQNYGWRQFFSQESEDTLEEYLLTCARMGFGLRRQQCLKIAYEMAVINNVTVPANWHQTKSAGVEWFRQFLKRHPNISVRKPEACSLSRGSSFNKHNVSLFYSNLKDVLSRHPSFHDGSRVFNLDETGTMTVQSPSKILAEKGTKQVSQTTSAERGTLVTTCCFINALGISYPPVVIFPRVNFKKVMLTDCYPGTMGLADKSGWMTGANFLLVIDHFVKLTNSSKENPSLLIMDNHESHLSIAVLDAAKNNGVTILTLPPHRSHKPQPLDVAVFGPFRLTTKLCRTG